MTAIDIPEWLKSMPLDMLEVLLDQAKSNTQSGHMQSYVKPYVAMHQKYIDLQE